jgi:hypothetical protein
VEKQEIGRWSALEPANDAKEHVQRDDRVLHAYYLVDEKARRAELPNEVHSPERQ